MSRGVGLFTCYGLLVSGYTHKEKNQYLVSQQSLIGNRALAWGRGLTCASSIHAGLQVGLILYRSCAGDQSCYNL